MADRGGRDPYEFKNQEWLPKVPVEVLTKLLKGWDADASDESDSYLNYFTPNAVLVFGGENNGREGIKKARDSMIGTKGPILKSSHFFETAFVTGGGLGIDGKWEIIGVADVHYALVGGAEVWTRAASWCRVVKGGDGQWQAERYEVFMDGTKLMDAISNLSK